MHCLCCVKCVEPPVPTAVTLTNNNRSYHFPAVKPLSLAYCWL